MPVKRSRENSSTHIEKPVSTVLCPLKIMKTEAAVERQQPTVGVSSVGTVGECDHSRMGGFLERCHYCRRRIPQNSEVFMYSNLCAFCSPECRDFQISLDCSAEKKHKNPKGERGQAGNRRTMC